MVQVLLVKNDAAHSAIIETAILVQLAKRLATTCDLVQVADLPAAHHHLTQAQVDLLLLDLPQPTADLGSAIKGLHHQYPWLPVVVLLPDANVQTIQRLLAYGAHECVPCDTLTPETLAQAALTAQIRAELSNSAQSSPASTADAPADINDDLILANALRDTILTITSSLDLDEVMKRILENIGRIVPHEAANIMLIQGEQARVAYWHNYPPEFAAGLAQHTLPLQTPNLWHMYTTRQHFVIPDTAVYDSWKVVPETAWVRSYAGVPIFAHGQVIGFLNLDSATPHFFTPTHLKHLQSIAAQAAIAIENAELYRQVKQYTTELEQRVIERTHEIRRAKEHVEAILNSSSDAILLTYADGTIRQVNPSFHRLFHWNTEEDIFGEPLTCITTPQNAPQITTLLAAIETDRQPRRIELTALRQDGRQFDADLALSPIVHHVEDNALRGIVCSVRDVSEQKAVQERLRQSLEKEKELSTLRSRFISMASHEFRTPLTTIASSAYLLQHRTPTLTDEQRTRHYKRIQQAIAQMNGLMEEVLFLGKSDAAQIRFTPEPTDLDRLCQGIVEDATLSTSGPAPIHYTYDGPTEPLNLDPNLVRAILLNLLTNAIKYSPEGQPIQFVVTGTPASVRFEVRDQGIGIPPADLDRIFESFHRAENVGHIAGTGLGLTIAQRSAHIHGGTITIDSQPDAGTHCTVTLPIQPVPPSVAPST